METPLKTPVNKINKDVRYTLETIWDDGMPYSYKLYKRIGCVFVEVDTFSSFAEANEEAKEIIRCSKHFSYLANPHANTQGSQQ
ncbi:hypothetical protein [Enterobacter roggenkampii]|uniref:hypothetical protein n=1 Tax=Enterobacter roggenkampii TaxID=1812935 RepID=UPI0008DCA67B|nr:hypothetical protein [Enterobacter roggenkampii]OHY45627.1 hypothetical protein BBX43_17510 [Enterobacter roggenkampii]OHY66291.1 hypothetical protein BB775_07510 [Enterobacter roggenkampii]